MLPEESAVMWQFCYFFLCDFVAGTGNRIICYRIRIKWNVWRSQSTKRNGILLVYIMGKLWVNHLLTLIKVRSICPIRRIISCNKIPMNGGRFVSCSLSADDEAAREKTVNGFMEEFYLKRNRTPLGVFGSKHTLFHLSAMNSVCLDLPSAFYGRSYAWVCVGKLTGDA